MKNAVLDEKSRADAEKLAEMLSKVSPQARKIIIAQANAAIITYQALAPYLKDDESQ